MINFLFLIAACVLMFFNLVYAVSKLHRLFVLGEAGEVSPRLQKMGKFYTILLLGFFAGYVAITVLWISRNLLHSANAAIVVQILFWGAVFVRISNYNLVVLYKTVEKDKKNQISDLNMSLEGYVNSIPGGVHHCVIKPSFGVVYVSEGFTDITGYDIEDMKTLFHGKYVELCYDDRDRELFVTAIRGILKNDSVATVVYRIRHKEGHYVWVSENMKSVRDCFGDQHIFAVLTDITMEKKQAAVDELTGLLNKGTFCTLSKEYMESHQDENLGLFMIDLDDFKTVNDTYGHAAGDKVLQAAGDILCSVLEKRNGIAGRVGGDEFMLLLKGVSSEEELKNVQTEIYDKLKIYLPELDEEKLVSGSAGYVFSDCSQGFEDAYHRADQAMYKEKEKRHFEKEL